MTLHEAIIKVLQQAGRALTTSEIADALNKNKWYEKKDKSLIIAYQIHGRTKNYPQYFDRQGSLVTLRDGTYDNKDYVPSNAIRLTGEGAAEKATTISTELCLKMLMNEKNFKSAGTIDQKVLDEPGLYCIRIADPSALPPPFNSLLTARGHNILYIGIATRSLRKRMLGQELRAEGHGTFFRGMGAVIGFRPPKGSLKNKKNKNNYTFSPADKKKIIQWMDANLLVNWVKFEGDFGNIETQLITQSRPLLNTDKNPIKPRELAELRRECRNIANS
ncbi:MAG: HTH domain-containing protein [Lentimicrobium sp.]|jgi:hypothetical protein|nr:HTH domain-containing protein [Lentimicrobium sp.]